MHRTHSNVFVIGKSGSGKSPVSKAISAHYKIGYISGGGWVRSQFSEDASRQRLTSDMVEYTQSKLRKNPDVGLEYLMSSIEGPTVIEGLRNPRDFMHVFDPRYDHLVYLQYSRDVVESTFDSGIEVIDSYASWLLQNKLLQPERCRRYCFDSYDALDEIILRETEVSYESTS